MSRELVVEHLPGDETIVSSRDGAPSIDILDRAAVQAPTIYPVVETWLTGHANGVLADPVPTPAQRVWHRQAWGCFHDLSVESDQELAGMGLAIIGNLCKLVASKQLSTQADAKLVWKRGQSDVERCLPWPGMPNDQPVPLDLCELPFDVAMFLHTEDTQFKQQVDRWALMRRIEAVWVPHLRALLMNYV